MTPITFIDAAQMVYDAGFPAGEPSAIAVAVITAESGRNPDAKRTNDDGSIDRGFWQINSKWHPEVSDACAYDPVCATKEAKRISNNGTDYSPWAVFTNGSYKSHMEAARVALDGADRQRRTKAQLAACQAQLAASTKMLGDLQNQLQGCQATSDQLGREVVDLQAKLAYQEGVSSGLQERIDAAKAALG